MIPYRGACNLEHYKLFLFLCHKLRWRKELY